MEKYNSLAKDIIAHVGGKQNIKGLRHCVTRLRFDLADESKAEDDYLKNLDGVITIMKAMGEYMVVIGEHVPHVYEEVCKELGYSIESSIDTSEKKEKQGIVQSVLGIITGAFGPALNMLCACGIIKGLLAILTISGVLAPEESLYALINAIGDSLFYFMPLLLGFNLAKKLGMEPFLGFIIGASICYPTINGVDMNLFGLAINVTYTATFLPVVFMVCLAAPLEKVLKKYIPEAVKSFLVPAIVLLIIVPIGYALVGPFANQLGTWVDTGLNALFSINTILAGTVFAGFWQVFVLFGIHGVITTFPFMSLMQGIPSQLMAFTSAASFSQIGVVLAIYIKTKDKKLKSIALPAFMSGIFGVTEPAIYGITLPRIKMFVISCIGAAVGGLIVAIADITMYTYAGMGVIGLLGLVSPENPQILPIVLMVAIPFVISFVMAFMLYKDEEVDVKVKSKSSNQNKEEILSPMKGIVKPLSESSDQAFATGTLGSGVIIIPEEGKVYAPFDGTVRTLFPTKHAIGIVSDNGCEILIHIGINTVRLNGQLFESHVKQGDTVKKGQLLVSFDTDAIVKKGYDISSPVIITNSDSYLEIKELNMDTVNNDTPLLAALY